uniref:FERM N-terminal domain-containing protein n=1 Tax=Accipiter nisus TaxID=211598 RepID=A0A8B9MEI5_9AVES
MPFGLKLRRTRRYNVLSKNCFVTRIRLLDSNVIECTLSVESTGQECLEAVAQRLELREAFLEISPNMHGTNELSVLMSVDSLHVSCILLGFCKSQIENHCLEMTVLSSDCPG